MLKTPHELSKSAQERVRAKLQYRGKAPSNESLRSVQLGPQSQSGGTVAQELADLIGVDIECLRIDDRFSDILSVDREELPKHVQPLMGKFGLTAAIDPFALDLVHYLENRVGRDKSRLQRLPFVPMPTNEDEWVERIMGMTIRQFLAALA